MATIDLERGIDQAAMLCGLLEMKSTAQLEKYWPHLPTVQDRAVLSRCMHSLGTQVISALPPGRRVAANDQNDDLWAAARASQSPLQHVTRIYGQARQVIAVMTELFPDQLTRLGMYKRRFTRNA
jgi:hypothetical protein